eukprot:m.24155 g.24155  ORF g.24155 m.24155 type:complete len:165 (-) comp8563_c0_seq1:189-683(-)
MPAPNFQLRIQGPVLNRVVACQRIESCSQAACVVDEVVICIGVVVLCDAVWHGIQMFACVFWTLLHDQFIVIHCLFFSSLPAIISIKALNSTVVFLCFVFYCQQVNQAVHVVQLRQVCARCGVKGGGVELNQSVTGWLMAGKGKYLCMRCMHGFVSVCVRVCLP